jgi:N-acetylglucosaminyldiphosphoundecaprenol N-acetyl-beta-D-mannosaminyltransferase
LTKVGHPGAFRSCGVRIDGYGLNAAVQEVLAKRASRAVHLCNAYTLTLAARDAGFAGVINDGALNLADGMPLVWIGRHLGFKQFDARVYGPDLMVGCLDQGRNSDTRHFLYGTTSETLRQLQVQIESRWPGARIVGAEAPRFGELDEEELANAADRMRTVGAEVVWVGLGTPKQDLVVDRFAVLGDATFVAVGAAFDFIAGTKSQAPLWMRERGLEWLFRLASEPRRLWSRYLVGNVLFMWHNLRRLPRVVTVK